MRADARAESSAERKAVALAFVARAGRAHNANYARSRTTCLRGPGLRSSLLIAATAARGPVRHPPNAADNVSSVRLGNRSCGTRPEFDVGKTFFWWTWGLLVASEDGWREKKPDRSTITVTRLFY